MLIKKFGKKIKSAINGSYEDMRIIFGSLKKKFADTSIVGCEEERSGTGVRGGKRVKRKEHVQVCKKHSSRIKGMSPMHVEEAKVSPTMSPVTSSIDVHDSDDEEPTEFISPVKLETLSFDGELEETIFPASIMEKEVTMGHEDLDDGTYIGERILSEIGRIENITFRRCRGRREPVLPSSGEIKRPILYSLKKVSISSERGTEHDPREELHLRTVSFEELPKDVRKIGEATFSEVFMSGDLVYKIVPLGEGLTTMESFVNEAVICRSISEEEGVCKAVDSFIARGRYTDAYLQAWDEYGHEENERPCKYGEEQEYGVIVMEDGGTALESYEFNDLGETEEFIRALVKITADLEQRYEFEHRDLHWGNILVKDGEIRIIDFSLSRMRTGDAVLYSDLNSKPWLFEGDEEEDRQFSVYKEMRRLCSECWLLHTPMSNVLWLRYVIDKVCRKKRGAKTRLSKYTRAAGRASSAVDMYRSLHF
jgi:serine/threonine-protein kinase haspin